MSVYSNDEEVKQYKEMRLTFSDVIRLEGWIL